MGCDGAFTAIYLIGDRFQSTHPHGVRREILDVGDIPGGISIHAPAWGATGMHLTAINSDYFNPRTRMGCDQHGRILAWRHVLFQSTHPHGVRHPLNAEYSIDLIISIHAPAWGATSGGDDCRQVCDISIHAPAWGATSAV